MDEFNENKFDFNNIFCLKCNDIKKIKIYSNWKEKTMNVSFECGHERNAQSNYKNNFNKNEELYFYCKTHKKKYNAYCEECKKNFCEECTCHHDIKNIKSKYDYFFTNSQIKELSKTYNEAKNLIRTKYSLDCSNKLSLEFENYYNIYRHIFLNSLFHVNIIYNINLFYNHFNFLISSKLLFTGFCSSSDINNIKDDTIFYDSSFKSQFNDLLNTKTFNFDNILNLFLLSKRFENKTDLFLQISNGIYSLIYRNTLAMANIENEKNKFEKYFNNIKLDIIKKENELINIQHEITNQILSLKFLNIYFPSSLKRKLISILQREIIKKYKKYLHEIKPNYFILNNIKEKYESFKKKNKDSFISLKLEEKISAIQDIMHGKKEKNSTVIDNVYFEKNFDNKNLMNTFIFFTKEIHFEKNKETHYSNKDEDKIFSNNQLTTEFKNNNNNINNSNNDSISHIKINNEPFINSNKNINNKGITEYKNLLNQYKNIFDNTYKDIIIKQKLNFENIIDALFKNDFSNIISIRTENKNNEFDNFINECLNELNEIKYEEDENQKIIKNLYYNIKLNKFQVEREKIFSTLISDRKYKNIVKKIKENFDGNNTDEEIKTKCYKDLIQSLIEFGGFDDINANQIISIIETYLYNSEEIKALDKEMENYINLSKENTELDFEINQLKKIRNYIKKVNDDQKKYNNNYLLNEMENIKNNFEINIEAYIKKNNDINYVQALKEIKEFIKGKNISIILGSLKNVCKGIEYNFYVDESIDLVSYCWAIQNGHDFIVDS